MSPEYYSDAVRGPRARVEEQISTTAWGGIVAIARSGVTNALFGEDYPEMCLDGHGPCGCDVAQFRLALESELVGLSWPLDETVVPDVLLALDLVQFLHQHASQPTERDFHSFYRHHHLVFDRAAGRSSLAEQVNRVFARNGIAYQLEADGRVVRLLPEPISEVLKGRETTHEPQTDELLEKAVVKFTSPDPIARKEALEHLWDAFERLKTILDARKKQGAAALVTAAGTSAPERALLDTELRALTSIGNDFRIRHHETNKYELSDELVDYLFVRMYALIRRVQSALPRP